MTKRLYHLIHWILVLTIATVVPAIGQDKGNTQSAANSGQEITELKALLADQQRQIQELRTALQEQKKLIESARQTGPEQGAPPASPQSGTAPLGQIASTTPIIPVAPAARAPLALPMPTAAAPQKAESASMASPLQIHIGDATITPVGFMDFTTVFRSTNTGNGIGTNFGGVPFSNAPNGKLTELRESAQNSRIGIRVDANVKGARILGYMESDFLGAAPSNLPVTSNSDPLRLRLYWVDVRKNAFEVLAGQSWSMLTPNRTGLSALPGDIFYSQLMDTNYQLGLTWSRQTQFRLIAHPNDQVAMGLSFEAPEQYIGGTNGIGAVALPTAVATPYANQLDNGTTTLSAPNVHPDIIAKIAFDPKTSNGLHQHVEIAGLFRTFKVYNPTPGTYFDSHGYGGSANVNFELFKGFHVISNNFFSDGGGRYIMGQAPDLIVRGDGSLSPVHTGSSVDGIEIQAGKNALLFAYWGGVYIRKNLAIDPATGKYVGYGFGNQNRIIQEPSFGIIPTFWKDPKYGALQLILQYSYVSRNPWVVASGTPSSAHSNMIFADLRYVLPGSAPTIIEK
ncbi:MAG TPA: hypothetical protein VLX58_14750 [Bryobacteraceae bacterium]|nr:hypothetical protein [Bryobacteraceae bacterium]